MGGKLPYRMRLPILRALAQLLEVNRVRVEAQVCKIPNHRAAAFDRPPRSILLRTTRVRAELVGFNRRVVVQEMISNLVLPQCRARTSSSRSPA